MSQRQTSFSIDDSFLRQYQSLFADYLAIKAVNNRVSKVAVSKKTNIHLYLRTHEMPYQNCALINSEENQAADFQVETCK